MAYENETRIVYNEIEIRNVLTHEISQTPVYNRANRDWQYTKYRIRVSGILWVKPQPEGPTPNPGQPQRENPDLGFTGTDVNNSVELHVVMAEALNALRKPKKKFQYFLGENVAHVSGPELDADNGPRPQVRLTRVISNTSAHIDFDIEFSLPCTNYGEGSGIVAFRYWQADHIGEDWLTTRVTKGFLRVRRNQDGLGNAITVHDLRNLCLPPIAPSFVRTSMHFDESPNGLELSFTIRFT